VLEGGIEGRPDNVILYATSNRRHLLAREMIENERSTAINPGEAVEEKVSLSDRFGLWLGFHRCSQDEYLAMVRGYCGYFGIKLADEELEREALEWSTTRGSRSGRVAWQFTQELAGRLGVRAAGEITAQSTARQNSNCRLPRKRGPGTPRLLGSIAIALEYGAARSSRARQSEGVAAVLRRAAAALRPVEELKRVDR